MNSFKKYRKIWVIVFFILINLINAMMIIKINKANNWLTTPGMTFNSILGNIGFIAVLLSLALIFCSQEKRLMIALVVETIILSVLLIGITMYYEFYKMFPSFYNLTVFNGESSEDALEFIISSIIELSKNIKWIFGLPIVAIVVLYIFINKNNDLHKEISLSSRKYQASIIFLIGVLLLGGSEKFYQQMVKGTWHEENTTVTFRLQAKGVFNFYLGEAIEYFITGEDEPEPEKIEEQLIKLKKYQNDSQISFIDNSEIRNNELYKGIFAGKNLLLIQLESESNFLIGLKVKVGTEYVEVTPNLNRLVDKSIYCNQFYTTVGIGNTSDAEFTAMTGINPNGNRYTVYEYYDQAYETLPKLFREKGYFSFATHANAGFFYSREENFINTYGFDLFFEKTYFEESILDYQDKLVHDWVGDVSFLEQTVREMKLQKEDTGKAVFSYPITVSNHLPYYLNKEQGFYGQKELLFPHGVEGISENYINYLEHASYNDYAIGKAIEALENEGLADDTIV